MIEYVTGDVTKPIIGKQKVIVHVCNDIGAWGAGVSGAIGRRWPEAEKSYRRWASSKDNPNVGPKFKLGRIQLVRMDRSDENITVCNLIGQHGLRSKKNPAPVRYDAIREGLQELFSRGQVDNEDTVVHMPRIGCGLAGGSWDMIEPIIREVLSDNEVHVVVYDLEQRR